MAPLGLRAGLWSLTPLCGFVTVAAQRWGWWDLWWIEVTGLDSQNTSPEDRWPYVQPSAPPPNPPLRFRSPVSNSSTRFFIHSTESSGTTAASEHTWGGEIGKLQTVNRVHFIFLDHFGKGREQQEAPRFKYSLLNRRETPGGRANCHAREVGGNLSHVYHPPRSQLAGPGTSPGTTRLVRQRASLHAPLHFILPFLHPCSPECSSYAGRPPPMDES